MGVLGAAGVGVVEGVRQLAVCVWALYVFSVKFVNKIYRTGSGKG